MYLQLVLRSYLRMAKIQYLLHGVPAPERVAFGIPGNMGEACNKQFFNWVLHTGELELLRERVRLLGHRLVCDKKLDWHRRYLFTPLEQYPGMVSGICLLTPEHGPVNIYVNRIAQRVPSRIFLRTRLSERMVHYPSIEQGFSAAMRMSLFELNATMTCDPV